MSKQKTATHNTSDFISEEYLEYHGHQPVELFPYLYDISPCINQSHPMHHPDTIQFERYWYEQEKRCIEGFWFKDVDPKDPSKGGWRFMPPQLYFYINFCIIEDEGEVGGAVSEIGHPKLRDVDWMFAYGWLAARKFSGFADDDDFTCHRVVEKIEKGEPLTPKEQFVFEGNVDDETGEVTKHKLNIYKKDGTLKKYIDAREYLYKTHSKELGLPLYENEARNFFVLGARGFGKSYLAGNLVIGHEYSFSGRTRIDELPQPKEIFVGSAITSKSVELLAKFNSSQEHRAKEFGSWGKNDDFIPGYFHLQYSGTLSPNSKSSYRNEYKYVENGTWMVGGTGTKIIHIPYTTENPDAAVGHRCSVMVIEEVGLLDKLLQVHGANETCQIRKTKFGSSLYIGTGGNMEKIIESQVVFEEPDKYNFLAYKDVWEGRTKPIGFFLPSYYVDSTFKDKNGNTNVKRAFAEEAFQRKQKEKASNSLALDSYIMARPIVPSEMFLSVSGNTFPVAMLRAREAEVETRKLFNGIASIGQLNWNTTKTEALWKEDTSPSRLQKPIRHLNLDSYKLHLEGAIVVYEHPQENIPDPTYKKSLYKVMYDPVRDDEGGPSLASVLVYKGYADKHWNSGIQDGIVAEWIGRPNTVREAHEIALKLAYYYNALVLHENNLPGFKTYCEDQKQLHRLMIEPEKAVRKVVQSLSSKKLYGVDMNPPRLHTHAEQLIRQWLLEEWKTLEDGTKKYNLDKITSPRLLKELSGYEPDKKTKFDHISSMKLLVLWLANEEHYHLHQENENKNRYEKINNFSKSLIKTYIKGARNPWFS